jgi:hypothetical protein
MTYEEVKKLFLKYPVASTWNSANPQALYFDTGPKSNYKSRDLGAPNLGERYVKVPFFEVASHIEKTGSSNSENIFYKLRLVTAGTATPRSETKASGIEGVDGRDKIAAKGNYDGAIVISDSFIREWHPKYDLIANDEHEYDRLVRLVASEIASRGTISRNTFLAIWAWKGAMRVIRFINMEEYESRYADAFRRAHAASPHNRLSVLIGPSTKLPGVEAATGSTILHFMDPSTMPIIDVRTIGVLFAAKLISSRQKDLEHYDEFCGAMDAIRARCPGWTLRQIDRALFSYDTEVLSKVASDVFSS